MSRVIAAATIATAARTARSRTAREFTPDPRLGLALPSCECPGHSLAGHNTPPLSATQGRDTGETAPLSPSRCSPPVTPARGEATRIAEYRLDPHLSAGTAVADGGSAITPATGAAATFLPRAPAPVAFSSDQAVDGHRYEQERQVGERRQVKTNRGGP